MNRLIQACDRVIAAAKAERPWWRPIESLTGDKIRCEGCGFHSIKNLRPEHFDGCRFAALDAALDAAEGSIQ